MTVFGRNISWRLSLTRLNGRRCSEPDERPRSVFLPKVGGLVQEGPGRGRALVPAAKGRQLRMADESRQHLRPVAGLRQPVEALRRLINSLGHVRILRVRPIIQGDSNFSTSASTSGAVEKIRAAEKTWLVYRDAYVDAMYPAEDKQGEYGSMYPMKASLLRARLTREQVAGLERMLRRYDGA